MAVALGTVHAVITVVASTAVEQPGQPGQPEPAGGLHRYSASRWPRPRAQPAAMIRDSTTIPASRPVNASRPVTACERNTA